MPTTPRSWSAALALAFTLWGWAAPALADDPVCELSVDAVPDFSLLDVNPGSELTGRTLSRDDFAGQTLLVYVALATCGHCQAQVTQLDALVEAQRDAWGDEVQAVVLALPGVEDQTFELTSRTGLPILQDTVEQDVAGAWGAEKWFVYLVDESGGLGVLHYSLNLADPVVQERLLAEIATLRAGGDL